MFPDPIAQEDPLEKLLQQPIIVRVSRLNIGRSFREGDTVDQILKEAAEGAKTRGGRQLEPEDILVALADHEMQREPEALKQVGLDAATLKQDVLKRISHS